jgi:hypothetical protein
MSVHRYAARRDANEAIIIEALRTVGATVIRLSETGVCDLLVGYRGSNYLIEIKMEKGKLTDEQFSFFQTWRGQCDVARTPQEALKIIGVDADE